MIQASEKTQKIHNHLQNRLQFFAEYAPLKIKTKAGDIVTFRFNRAQEYLHAKLEDQRRRTGKVRALIIKGRQQGCSTYIAARFYHRATRNFGQSVFILSHEAETTKKLFGMVDRFQTNCIDQIRPEARIANRREYQFAQIQSDYTVGTAGNENVGRGGTLQLFHGSEVAYWDKTDEIETGIMQSVADLPGTEVILESTANGMGNMFYFKCMDALEGKTDYELIFIPWYWQTEYRRAFSGELILTPEEEEYQKTYALDLEQMAWRRAKIAEFKSEWKFKQEYPANVQEAFQTSGETFIKSEAVMRARKSEITDPEAPLIMAIDPGRNRDRTIFLFRRGRQVLDYSRFTFDLEENVQMLIAGKAAKAIDGRQPDMVFIDTGEGYGVRDRLRELGYGEMIQMVNFGAGATEEDLYLNKRAEMWCHMRDWLHGEDGEVSIPDDDVIHKDLTLMPPEKHTSRGLIQLVSKDIIRTKFRMSTDIADALALTFAFPVKREHNMRQRVRKAGNTQSPLLTMRRIRRQKGGQQNVIYN